MAKGGHAHGSSRVFGRHAARAVIERRPEAIAAAQVLAGASSADLAALARALEALGVPVERLPRARLDLLAGHGAHQGIIIETQSVTDYSLTDFEEMCLARSRSLRLLVLDGVEDPRNLGACLRTADAAGVDAVIVPKSRGVGLTPAVQKAATGAAETVPLLRAPNLVRTLKWLQGIGVWIVGTHAEARHSLLDAELATPIAVVLGAEGRGLRRLTRETCDELVAIPMAGTVQSLNVSVAAGVVLFELLRQTSVRVPPERA